VRDLEAVRRRFLALAVALAMVAGAAAIFLLTPYGRSREGLQADDERLRVERNRKELENGPLADIDQKLALARRQIDTFYRDRLPEQYSDVSTQLSKVAAQSGVRLGQVRYELAKDAPGPGVRAVHISVGVTGNYLNLVKFINALERDQTLFVPSSLELSEGQTGVTLTLRLDTYLRDSARGAS
jgi:Tfp pilus assembly protein PilO